MTRVADKPRYPVLFLLDEFPALRRMEPVEKAIAYARGYGARFWLIVQDINQLQSTYGSWARSLIANCRCKAAFGIADITTARELAAMLGQQTIITQSTTDSGRRLFGPDSRTFGETGRDLLMADEILRLPGHQQILLITGQRPILAMKIRYYEEKAFKGLWERWR